MNDLHNPDLSVVVPVFQEVENVKLLYDEIRSALEQADLNFEIVIVDDGSTDGTIQQLHDIATDQRVKLVLFRRNYGQTAAMNAGINHACGKYIVTMDGDLQNDPQDIPMMIEKLEEGYDLVHGWRKNRQDKFLSRKLPSKLANWLISRTTGFPIHDLGCTLKAMRREIAQELELYGEMHRFIPILADQLGARAVEVVTHHRARQFGTTKYGIGRTFRVILDLITVRYMQKYFASPMKLFGMIGIWIGFLAMGSVLMTTMMKIGWGTDMTGNPMLLLGILCAVLSVQFFSLGLIGEVAARIYYSQHDRQNYRVRKRVNFDQTYPRLKMFPREAA